MKTLIASIVAGLFATTAFAASAPQEAQTPGSEAPKAVAESIHLARTHGIDNTAPQPLAQAPGSAEAQQKAEDLHLRKDHGNINNSADERMMKDASRL